MQFQITFSNRMGAKSLAPFETTAALKKVLQLRSQGYHNIKLTELSSGVEVDIEQFILDHGNA